MIRVFAILSLTVLLVLVLYLPSAYPPERFTARLRAEHAQTVRSWNSGHASHILARTLDAQESARQVSPVPSMPQAPAPGALDAAVANEVSAVNTRLFNNPYFRSIDALLLLATYRLYTLLEWLPWLAPFMVAASVDGLLIRAIRTKEFGHHDPEMFAVYGCASIVLLCATAIALVTPMTLHPFALPSVFVAAGVLIAKAFTHLHHRG